MHQLNQANATVNEQVILWDTRAYTRTEVAAVRRGDGETSVHRNISVYITGNCCMTG